MRILTLIFMFTVSASAFASDFKHCQFEGDVVSIDQDGGLAVQVKLATRLEGSYTDCQEYIGKSLNVTTSEHDYSVGDSVTLEYNYSSGLTPKGVVVSESLIILD